MRTPKLPFWAVILFTIGAQAALASTQTFTIDLGNSQISGFPAPYGFVTATDVGTAVKFQISGNTAVAGSTCPTGGCYYLIGDGASFSLNATGKGPAQLSVLSAVGVYNGVSTNILSILSEGPPPNESSLGSFSYNLSLDDGPKFAYQSATITIDGLQVADLVPNSDDHTVRLHIYPTSAAGYNHAYNSATGVGTLSTGYAANTVPDGGFSVMLLGGALLGIEVLRRKLSI